MKKLLFLLFFHLSIIPFAFSQEAKDVVKKADEKAKGKTSIANITIQTIRPTWSREMSVKVWILRMLLQSAAVLINRICQFRFGFHGTVLFFRAE